MATNPAVVEAKRAYHEKYADSLGLPPFDPEPSALVLDKHLAKVTGLAYDAATHRPDDPGVRAAYDAMKREVRLQYDNAVAHGLRVTPHYEGGPGGVYDYTKIFDDVRDNNHLSYEPTERSFGPHGMSGSTHPLTEEVPDMPGVVYNDLFRVVHDYYGHVQHGHDFSPQGELRAWHEHARMFSPLARRALTTETHGQNSWLHFGPHLRGDETSDEKPYAEQKAAVLDESLQPVRLARMTVGSGTPVKGWHGGEMHEHNYYDESGNPRGVVWVSPHDDGRHLRIHWIGTRDGKVDPIGAEGVRSIAEGLKQHYPGAQFASGRRISGFRKDKPELAVVKLAADPRETHAWLDDLGSRDRDRTSDQVFSDWLQERDDPRWFIPLRHVGPFVQHEHPEAGTQAFAGLGGATDGPGYFFSGVHHGIIPHRGYGAFGAGWNPLPYVAWMHRGFARYVAPVTEQEFFDLADSQPDHVRKQWHAYAEAHGWKPGTRRIKLAADPGETKQWLDHGMSHTDRQVFSDWLQDRDDPRWIIPARHVLSYVAHTHPETGTEHTLGTFGYGTSGPGYDFSTARSGVVPGRGHESASQGADVGLRGASPYLVWLHNDRALFRAPVTVQEYHDFADTLPEDQRKQWLAYAEAHKWHRDKPVKLAADPGETKNWIDQRADQPWLDKNQAQAFADWLQDRDDPRAIIPARAVSVAEVHDHPEGVRTAVWVPPVPGSVAGSYHFAEKSVYGVYPHAKPSRGIAGIPQPDGAVPTKLDYLPYLVWSHKNWPAFIAPVTVKEFFDFADTRPDTERHYWYEYARHKRWEREEPVKLAADPGETGKWLDQRLKIEGWNNNDHAMAFADWLQERDDPRWIIPARQVPFDEIHTHPETGQKKKMNRGRVEPGRSLDGGKSYDFTHKRKSGVYPDLTLHYEGNEVTRTLPYIVWNHNNNPALIAPVTVKEFFDFADQLPEHERPMWYRYAEYHGWKREDPVKLAADPGETQKWVDQRGSTTVVDKNQAQAFADWLQDRDDPRWIIPARHVEISTKHEHPEGLTAVVRAHPRPLASIEGAYDFTRGTVDGVVPHSIPLHLHPQTKGVNQWRDGLPDNIPYLVWLHKTGPAFVAPVTVKEFFDFADTRPENERAEWYGFAKSRRWERPNG